MDWLLPVLTFVAAITASAASVYNSSKLKTLKVEVNHRLTEMLITMRAQGNLEGRAELIQEQKDLDNTSPDGYKS